MRVLVFFFGKTIFPHTPTLERPTRIQTLQIQTEHEGAKGQGSSEIVGLIRRQNGGNATIVGQHTDGNKTFNDGGFNPSYTISADTSNQALKIDVTGIAATNIHTVAVVNVTEVKYV